jgi:hypothetical protein
MSYTALVKAFSKVEDLPIPVDAILSWIRENTDHKDIRLHPVDRHKRAFRGAFRRIAIPKGAMYGGDFDIVTQVLFGADLPDEWKRLVIVKEALHVFDAPGDQVNTPEGLRKLIPAIITPELRTAAPFSPAVNDYLGAYRALAVLLPRFARRKLRLAIDNDRRTSTEIADYAKLPDHYVGIWLNIGEEAEHMLAGF